MNLQTDHKIVFALAEEKKDENWRFRSFLKRCGLNSEELDAIVHRHYEDVASQIDCLECGNCCRLILPTLSDDDVKNLAAGLGISPEEVIEVYLVRNESGELTLNQLPCPLLEGNRCRVFDHRPENCRSYPHLHKKDFVFRLINVVWNYSICPIVFNVYERLKEELRNEFGDAWDAEPYRDDFMEEDL